MQNFISRIGQGGGGGGGGDAGAGEMWGIDTSRVLKASTVVTSSAPFTYTATENCWARISLAAQDNTTFQVTIDDVPVTRLYANGQPSGTNDTLVQVMLPIPLLKGQTLKATSTYNTYPGGITIYGSKTASGESGSGGHIYSTEEKLIGKWIDGKDLYEQSFRLTGTFRTSNNINVPINNFDFMSYEKIVVKRSDGIYLPVCYAASDSMYAVYGVLATNKQWQHRAGNFYASSTLYFTDIFLTLQFTKA